LARTEGDFYAEDVFVLKQAACQADTGLPTDAQDAYETQISGKSSQLSLSRPETERDPSLSSLSPCTKLEPAKMSSYGRRFS
jgi:hypothetical protein